MLWMDLRPFEVITVNTSAGKDSQVMLWYVCKLAKEQGVLDRVYAVHCDLGRVEWAGTRELAQEQCNHLGVPLIVCHREIGDLLTHVEGKGKWPGYHTRYCTSEHKRDQVTKVITQLVYKHNLRTYGRKSHRTLPAVQVLNCIGLRAQESDEREKEPIVQRDDRASSGVREITRWLPVHDWTEEQVWACIRETGMPYHRAYDLGMPRLSCCFCIFAEEPALLLSGYHNRALLGEYVAIEAKISHTFKPKLALVNIQAKLDAGYVPQGKLDASAWAQCAGGM